MPAIRDSATTGTHVNGTVLTTVLPRNIANDLLLLVVQHDAVNLSWETPVGWTPLYSRAYGSGVAIFWKISSGAEVPFDVVNPTSDGRNATIISIYDYNQAAPFGATPNYIENSASYSTYSTSTLSLTTTVDECLVLHMFFTGFTPRTPQVIGPCIKNITQYTNTNGHGAGFAYSYQETAGPTPTTGNVIVQVGSPGASVELLLQISPPTTGPEVYAPHVVADEGQFICPYNTGMFPTPFGNISFTATIETSWAAGLGELVVTDANTFGNIEGKSYVENTNVGNLTASSNTGAAGGHITFGTGVVMDNDYALLVHFQAIPTSPPKFGSLDNTGGICVAMRSSEGNSKGWIANANEVVGLEQISHYPHVIVPSAEAQYINGTLNSSLINTIALFAAKGATGVGANAFFAYQFWKIRATTICGGHPSKYSAFEECIRAFSSDKPRYTALFQGSSQALVFQPFVVGDGGAHRVRFNWSFSGLEFASTYSVARRKTQVHAPDNWLGLQYNLGPDDVLIHSNAVVTSRSRYHWGLHPDTSVLATYDFSRLFVIGAGQVTINKAITLNRLVVEDYVHINAENAILTNCTLSTPPAANNALQINASTMMTNTSIDASTTAAGNYLCSSASLTPFTGCQFEGGGGHAIRLTAPGTFTSNGITFTGFGINGSDGAAILNDSGGHITINVSGGSAPTYKNVGLSTTTIQAAVAVTIEGNVSLLDAEVRIYDLDNDPVGSFGTELAGVENNPDATFTFTTSAGNLVKIQIMQANYKEYTQQYTVPAESTTLNVRMTRDLVA